MPWLALPCLALPCLRQLVTLVGMLLSFRFVFACKPPSRVCRVGRNAPAGGARCSIPSSLRALGSSTAASMEALPLSLLPARRLTPPSPAREDSGSTISSSPFSCSALPPLVPPASLSPPLLRVPCPLVPVPHPWNSSTGRPPVLALRRSHENVAYPPTQQPPCWPSRPVCVSRPDASAPSHGALS